jgi:dihydrofolate reductase
MRKLKLEMQTSLDGFTADSRGDTSWMVWPWSEAWTWDEPLRQHHNRLTESADCIVISGRMAREGFCDHWERVAADARNPQSDFARHVVATRKLVATRSSEPSRWRHTEMLRGDLVEQVARLKAEPGKDILVYGGPTLASALMDARLIDEVHHLVNPVVLGQGRSMLKDLTRQARLQPLRATAFACGVVLIESAVQT